LVRQHADEVAKRLQEEVANHEISLVTTTGHANGKSNGHANGSAVTTVPTDSGNVTASLQLGASQMSMDKMLASSPTGGSPSSSTADFCPDCGLATLRFV
jgi:hypothetical protein